jgi:hypothetical protein
MYMELPETVLSYVCDKKKGFCVDCSCKYATFMNEFTELHSKIINRPSNGLELKYIFDILEQNNI